MLIWYQMQCDKFISTCSAKNAVEWLLESGLLFCLCNQLLLCYSSALPRPRTYPLVPTAPIARHGPMRVAIVVPPPCCGGCHPLQMKILLYCCIPAEFNELKAPKNTNSWKTAELTRSSSRDVASLKLTEGHELWAGRHKFMWSPSAEGGRNEAPRG